MLFGFLFCASGYALMYYGIDVLAWAHISTSSDEPVTLAACFGFTASARSTPFMPPVTLGTAIPGAITDARGLLGGVATTGEYQQAQVPTGGAGGAGDPALATTAGGTPVNGSTAAGGGAARGNAAMGSTARGGGGTTATNPRPGATNFIGPVSASRNAGQFIGPVSSSQGGFTNVGTAANGQKFGMRPDGSWDIIP